MMISDEQLEVMADEFIRLGLSLYGITLIQFINNPDECRKTALKRLRQKITAMTGRVDEPMKANRWERNAKKSNFQRRAQP
ncbi:MAG: hypothetical protein CMI13_04245 [Oleibacter sp.]|nr:hypothetical protein [Thalassolituus sp.]|tara:strand:- start:4164 stop:4406 length:243 start_codon:yes stop_codon:yes gene_type:complete